MTAKSNYGKVTKTELIAELERTKEMVRLFHRYAEIPNHDMDEGWCNTEARYLPLSICVLGLKEWEKHLTTPVIPKGREGRDHSTDY